MQAVKSLLEFQNELSTLPAFNEVLIEKIKTQLFPNNSLQERVENFATYYSKYGKLFISDLIVNFDVYNQQFLIFDR